MKNNLLSFFFLISVFLTNAQSATKSVSAAELPFKYDQLYKTMYAREVCVFLQKHPETVLIDVRTPGEFSDTSRYANLNQGHLKDAINLSSEIIKQDISVMEPFKNKTIVLYCSHSQRSRRISKLLFENGFRNFYNLNGGMSSLNQLTEIEFPCKKEWIVSGLSFKNYSVEETMDLIKNEKELTIIDVRTVEQFNSADSLVSNNIGRIKGSINIPYALFEKRLSEIKLSKEKPVLIVGESGESNTARAAEMLVKNDFKKVSQLLGGIDDFIANPLTATYIENATPYHILHTPAALKLLQTNEKLIVYDTRNDNEYNNKLTGSEAFRNLGHIKNAIHVTENLFGAEKLPANKERQILIYGNREAYTFAKQLTEKGYKFVYLMPRFYEFVWSGFNIESCKETRNFVVDHQGFY